MPMRMPMISLHHRHMAKAPLPHQILEVDEFLGEFVEIEICLRFAIDLLPDRGGPGIVDVRLADVAIEHRFGDGQPAHGP